MYDDPLKSPGPLPMKPSPGMLVAGLILVLFGVMVLIEGIAIVVTDANDPHRFEHDGIGALPGYFFMWVAALLLACGVPFTVIGGYRQHKYNKQLKQLRNWR